MSIAAEKEKDVPKAPGRGGNLFMFKSCSVCVCVLLC